MKSLRLTLIIVTIFLVACAPKKSDNSGATANAEQKTHLLSWSDGTKSQIESWVKGVTGSF